MTIVKKPKPKKVIIDLTGPEGNVYYLIGCAQRFAKQLDLNAQAIIDDMISNDYEHAIAVFDEHFGNFVTLWR